MRSTGIRDPQGEDLLHAELSGTQMRILRILEITRRPLQSAELEGALGIASHEGHSACRWLTDNGYVARSTEPAERRPGEKATFWSLAEKGRTLAKSKVR